MSDKKIIIFDLDGTMLPTVNQLSERTVRAVKLARDAGHYVIASSARPYAMLRWVYEKMGMNTAVSTLNGGWVMHPTDKSFPTFICTISEKTVRIIADMIFAEACHPLYVERFDKMWYTDGDHNSYYSQRIEISSPGILLGRDDRLPDTDASRMIFTPPTRESAERIMAAISKIDEVEATMWTIDTKAGVEGYRISVGPVKVDKLYSMQYLAKYYGVDIKDCYAFGDNWNDRRMIEGAGHGYALKDSEAAEEWGYPTTRYSCAEDGVAEFIEREILGLES